MIASRWLVLLISTAYLCVLCGCCCGTTTYKRTVYYGGEGSYSSDLGRAYAVIGSTHTTAKTGALDSEDVYQPPYTFEVGVSTTGEYAEPVRLLAAEVRHQGETIMVHDRSAAPLEDTLVFDEERGKWETRFEWPLGDTLPFVDGSTAEATVVVDLPWEEREIILKRTFTGEQSESTGTLFDALMGV